MAESSKNLKHFFWAAVLFSALGNVLLSSGLPNQVEPRVTYKYCLSLPSDDYHGGRFDCSQRYLKQIPDFLPTSTEDLYLFNNLIKVLDKYSFQKLSNLKRLNLSDNHISIITADSFMNLPYLEILDLSFNGIRLIPCNAFISLHNLKFLRLLDIVNLEFGKCSWNGVKHLKYLEMSFYFKNTIIENFEGLENIETLRMWVNYKRNETDQIIHNCLNMSMFHTLPRLKLLDLTSGKFYCIEGPSVFHSSTDLVKRNGIIHLAIGYNRQLTRIFPGSFAGMSSLQSLDITSCYNLKHIDASVFVGLQNLDRLVLNNGNLLSLDAKQFSELKRMSSLDLSGSITSKSTIHSSAFAGLSNALSLNLSFGGIHSIDPLTFADFRNLTHLDISLNSIGYIDARILYGLSNLKYLNLLSKTYPINIDPSAFQDLHNLEYLCLSNDMHIEVLEPLKSLTSLDWTCPRYDPLASFCGLYLFHYIDVSRKYSSLNDWMSSFPNLRKVNFLSLGATWFTTHPFVVGTETMTILEISKCTSDKFELISLYVPQNVDLQQHFEEWIKDISKDGPENQTLPYDKMIPNVIKSVLLYADIDSLNLTMPKYFMPLCDVNVNEYIKVQSLFFNSGSDTMDNVFSCFRGLNFLYLNQSIFPLRYIHRNTFSNLESLKLLDISGNSILFISENMFHSLPNLIYLNMIHNAFQVDAETIGNLSMLQAFHFDTGDDIYLFSRGCCRVILDSYDDWATDDIATSLDKEVCNNDFPKMNSKDGNFLFHKCIISRIFENSEVRERYGNIMRCVCDPSKIEVMNMTNPSIFFREKIIYFQSLKWMTVSLVDDHCAVLYVPKLIEIDLSHSKLQLNNYNVEFRETQNVRSASFSYTGFDIRDIYTQCNETSHGIIFQSFVNLQYLNVTHCGITTLCQFYFQRLINLTYIDLSYNKISMISKDTFEYSAKLTTINLSGNRITLLHPATFEHLAFLSGLYFENNPLNCDCDKAYIQKWMTSAKNLAFTMDGSLPWQTYTCSEPSSLSGKPFIMIDHYRIACYETQIKLVAIVVLIIPILLVSRIVWKKRWHLIYKAYKRINQIKQRYPLYFRLEDKREYEFDAFVSFSEGDSDWIDEQLQPFMEDELELRLCIHTRDFHGGKDIFTNIEENIKKSRKIIFIVSENFVKSPFCDFEMRLAFTMMLHALHDESILLFIMLEKVPQKDMSDILKFFVNTKTYLAWPVGDENEDEREHFWEQLRGIVTDQWEIL